MTHSSDPGSPAPIRRLLVANRGEIAVRVLRTASWLGVETIAVTTPDDRSSLHVAMADTAVELPSSGVAGYLDVTAIVDAAVEAGADAVHPGYGFLAESTELALRCEEAGLVFVGPSPEHLDLFGDKVTARRTAAEAGIPVLDGSTDAATRDDAAAVLARFGGVMLKAVAGGGGRGMRAVRSAEELDQAWDRCVSEATRAFGRGDLYAERLVGTARHIEVQIVGDGTGAVVHLGERDCSIQRRHQKLVEIAPAPELSTEMRDGICEAAVRLGEAVSYRNIGTVEFLVDASAASADEPAFWFIEANPRIQVEHTVTEEVTGVDLVEAQLRLAAGEQLADVVESIAPIGWAVQARVNAESIGPAGEVHPSAGTITTLELASGPGVRVDSAAQAGAAVNPSFDSLLAKVVVHRRGGTFADTAARLYAALCECRVDGVDTNLGFLRNVARHPGLPGATTDFVERHLEKLSGPADHPLRHRAPADAPGNGERPRAGARLDSDDPLAVLAYGRQPSPGGPAAGGAAEIDDGPGVVRTPLQGTVTSVEVAVGDEVRANQLLAVVEAMKMEHEVRAATAGVVEAVTASAGDTLWAGEVLLRLAVSDATDEAAEAGDDVDLDEIGPSLARVLELRGQMMDEARPEAVAKRHKLGHRTARENVADLIDEHTFVEYGPMALAAQRRRRSREDLVARSPADGLITGVGSVNGEQFGDPASRCAVMAYDYTVFAGTQGIRNHAKTDRIIDVASEGRMPLVIYAEGGGGRPGDTDGGDFGSRTFSRFATLSGLVPMVGVVSGRCFAGNASLLGCCDVIIATRDANIGMGGPAMIEGGGLGVFRPEDIGPTPVQTANGVIDVLVDDEAAATETARQYLSYFQGVTTGWEANDQRLLRRVVPENRLRAYDVHQLIDTLADAGSVLELRPGFGHGMVTALVRIEGRPMGLIANNPHHLGGAIDSDGSDKAARFMQLCDAFDLPILYLCDTPGIMVGPEIETTALVRHSSRLFLIGANLTVPTFTVVVRKSYGLGGIAMAGGSYTAPVFTVAWPTAEFGPMGLEGSVKLGFRDVLAAIDDPDERKAKYDELVAKEYERGSALNYATGFAVDDTIDPADTRHWLANLMASLRPPPARTTKKRAAVDGW